MSERTPLIGLICTFIGVILSIFVYVDTSSKISDTVDALQGVGFEVDDVNPWGRIEVLTLLFGFILGVVLLIVYVPVVFIEMGWCGCLGTVTETAVKGAFHTKGRMIQIILTGLSVVVFVLVLVYLIHGEIVVGEFNNVVSGVLTIVAVIFFLINMVMSVLYIRS
ncbi:uncharacterized protein LOC134815434 [Bolinopsis microptera]|uniref:uncharacterized protein LOC134815434 n=1 Tax=Bolinopsis microptera TaxID=2820187 RepID=UPI00307A4B36